MQGQFTLHRALFIQSRKDKITDHYEFDSQPLGRGAYGVVYRAKMRSRENTWRAVKKILKKSIKNPKQFENQVEIMKTLDHPNIIKIYETFQEQHSVYLVTDLCEGGELFDRLDAFGNFSEEDAREIFQQIAEAVNYCHTQKIAHRDLKPENFIFVNKASLSLKLIDFGLSNRWTSNMKEQLLARKETKLVGTSYYIAPEIIQGSYDERCDIWSMGVILYILVTACPPFDGNEDKDIIESVRKRQYTLDIPEMSRVSSSCKEIIRRILVSPDERLTLKQIFQHPWMTSMQNKDPLKVNFAKMGNFTRFSKLKTLAVTYIASQLSDKEIERLGVLFKQVDLNHDGFLTVEELKIALENQKEKASLVELKHLMDYIDTDKNGKINYTEFVASCLDNSLIYKEENLKMVFQMLDKDGNGVVSAQELRETISQVGEGSISAKVIDEIIRACDKNGDGMIDYKEFLQNISQV